LLALVVATVALALLAAPRTDETRDASSAEARHAALLERIDALSDAVAGVAEGSSRTATALDELKRKATALEGLVADLAKAQQPPEIEPGVKFHDTFEKGTDGWMVLRFLPMVIGDLTRTMDEGRAKEGQGALSLTYVLEQNKMPLIARGANNISYLSLWIRTLERPAEIYIGVTEFDESRYGTMVHLEVKDGWQRLSYPLANLQLAEDSRDENGRLDFDRLKGISITDIGGFMGNTGSNTLLVDEVVGEYRAKDAVRPDERREAF
jgi:hypothetical protein